MDHSGGCGGGEKEKDSGCICQVDVESLLIDWDVKESITSRRAQTFFGSSNWKCEITICSGKIHMLGTQHTRDIL